MSRNINKKATQRENRPVRRTLRGLVTPAQWDADGKLTAVAIMTNEEEEYLIESDEFGALLMDLQRSLVEVYGSISIVARDEKHIRVKKFRVLNKW